MLHERVKLTPNYNELTIRNYFANSLVPNQIAGGRRHSRSANTIREFIT